MFTKKCFTVGVTNVNKQAGDNDCGHFAAAHITSIAYDKKIRRHGVCIAIECSYKLDQKNEFKFLCELCTFLQIRSHI